MNQNDATNNQVGHVGPRIFDGRVARDFFKKNLSEKITLFKKQTGITPTLAIIQIGNREDSNSYISNKKKFAEAIGAVVVHRVFSESVSAEEILEAIHSYNSDTNIHGVIVQLPIPVGLDKDSIINAVDSAKDVDGLTESSVAGWNSPATGGMYPATARGIKELLEFYQVKLSGKKVAVVGRSMLVGKPTAVMCERAGAEVTVAHSKTDNLIAVTKPADIIIVAVGKPNLITADHVRSGQVIVDVGTTPTVTGLAGDVSFEEVAAVIGEHGAITPVPGGVGAMTVLALFENLLDACYNQHKVRII